MKEFVINFVSAIITFFFSYGLVSFVSNIVNKKIFKKG